MRIPSEVLTRILESTDILDVASGRMGLKKAGREYKALCPFHEEKTPSFHINAEKGVYYCQGCHEGGNTIDLLMKLEGLSFPEAARALAARAGITIPEQGGSSDEGPTERIRGLMAEAEAFFTAKLLGPAGASAREYLAQRGISEAIRKAYGLGLSPEGWTELSDHFKAKKVPESLLVQAGLSAEGKSGRGVYDRFRGRLMFPIRSGSGKTVGFGARALKAGDEPKYLNSPEGALYHKGDVLYGLSESRPLLKPKSSLVLVEGYVDVLAMASAGIPAAAPCGTALTDGQARLAGRAAESVTILLDADEAGRRAALKAFGVLGANGVEARVCLVEGGKDPADVLKESGAEAVRSLLGKPMTIVDYYAAAYPPTGAPNALESRMVAAKALLPEIRRIKDPDARNLYGKRLEERFGIPWRDEVPAEPQAPRARNSGPVAGTPQATAPQAAVKPEEERLVRALLVDAKTRATLAGVLTRAHFQSPTLGEIAEALVALGENPSVAQVGMNASAEARKWFYALVADEERNLGEVVYADRYWTEMTTGRALRERIAEAAQVLRDAEARGDEAEVNRLLELLVPLQKQLRKSA